MLLRSWKAAPGSAQAELTNYCLHTQTAAVGRQQQPTALRLFATHCTNSYQEQLNKVIAAKLIASLFLQRYNIKASWVYLIPDSFQNIHCSEEEFQEVLYFVVHYPESVVWEMGGYINMMIK